jgi:hypothetical protein
VSLAEVTDLTERDPLKSGIADGNDDTLVALKPLRGSGEVPESIVIVRKWGGFGARLSPPDPLNPPPFKKGSRYWFIWSSVNDVYWHRILMWWPEDDVAAPVKEMEAAIKADRYAWSPQYLPDVSLFYGRKVDAEKRHTAVRVTKGDKTLWEKTLPGLPSGRLDAWHVYEKQHLYDLKEVDAPEDQRFLSVGTDVDLPQANEFDQPEGAYYANWRLDLGTGRVAVATVGASQFHSVYTLNRYSLETGRLVFQSVNTPLPSGGKAVGADEEGWWRQVQRTYDPKTGEKTSEEVFRLAGPRMEPVAVERRE